jgi:hypothetical protein
VLFALFATLITTTGASGEPAGIVADPLDGAEENPSLIPPPDAVPIVVEPDPDAVDPDTPEGVLAPQCFSLAQWDQKTGPFSWKSWAKSVNFCRGTYRIRFIWAWAGDTACYSIPPGWGLSSWRAGKPPYVSEIRLC